MRFLDLDFEDTVPDAKTLWLFRDTLSNKNAIDKLFRKFNRYIDREDLFARQGQLIYASIVPVPIQHSEGEHKYQTR
jgi:IS5 family transposase